MAPNCLDLLKNFHLVYALLDSFIIPTPLRVLSFLKTSSLQRFWAILLCTICICLGVLNGFETYYFCIPYGSNA